MCGDITGDINYYRSTTDGRPPCVIPYSIQTEHRSNLEHEYVRMALHDLRGKEQHVHLDTNGFEIVEYHGCIQEEFTQDSEEQKLYYQEMSDILKQRVNASKVIVYNYAFRSRGLAEANEKYDDSHREPAVYPHVDIAESAVRALAEILLGKEDADKAMKNRVQVINIWRPLGTHPITQKPLTICDYQSINSDKDVHPYTVSGAKLHRAGLLMSRNTDDAHKWYYLSRMQSHQMFVFKMADTKSDVARFACHTAFNNENEPMPNEKQISVEVRCLVLYDEQ